MRAPTKPSMAVISRRRRWRVFGNADGAYGSNVNHLVENGRWSSEDELAQTYLKRKSFGYGPQRASGRESCLVDKRIGVT